MKKLSWSILYETQNINEKTFFNLLEKSFTEFRIKESPIIFLKSNEYNYFWVKCTLSV